MRFRYSYEKNSKLLQERGIGFEEIICAISEGNLLDILHHYNQDRYPGQKILYVRVLQDVYAVPYVEEDDGCIFLKTLFASRKARKKYLGYL